METVGDRLAKAQASGDINQIRAALQDAKDAGADPAHIEEALAEVARLEAGKLSSTSAAAGGAGNEDAAAKAAAAEAAAARASAEAFKKRGNERLKDNTKSAAREAMECFTTGIEVRCSDNLLNAQLYGNRAHVRILLRQFVEAVDDCRKAIELDPKNTKSYWRGAKASMQLDLFKNAIDFCEAGLAKDPANDDLMKLKSACADKLQGQMRRRAEISATHSKDDFNADEAMALQERVNVVSEQVEQLKAQLGHKQRERQKLDSTTSILGELTPETNTYIAVGRCFLKKEKDYLDKQLVSMKENLDADIPKMTKALQELEKRKEASEKELREMIQAFKSQTSGQE